ncbi:MAG: hypothetical protein ACRELY_31530 [Polyangiaceae bacterium]
MRKHIASLLAKSQKQPALSPSEAPTTATERDVALTNLYLWLREWRETARTAIKNRSQLIQLGIAKRRANKAATTPAPSPVVVTPVATPEPPPAVAVPQLPAASASSDVVDKAAMKVA